MDVASKKYLPSGDPGLLTLGDDLQIWTHIVGAGGYWLGGALHLDQAHTAVSSHGQPLVVAEAGNLDSGLLARLVDRIGTVNLHTKC